MLINIDNLNFAYGVDDIFKNAKFYLKEKERVGLVGPNGIGKSTFIKILTNQLEPDSGNIIIDSKISIGHLEQEIDFDQNKTLNDLFNNIFYDYRKKEKRLRELEQLISDSNPGDLEKLYKEYDKLQEFSRRENIYSHESLVRGMINGLGLNKDDLLKPFKSLSGGEKTRVILAMILLRSPDLLILDEPTNFLDIKTLDWLENTLVNYKGSILLISHDRYFLNKVCTRIVEIEDFQFNSFPGNYDNYAQEKEIQRAEQNKLYMLALKEVERQKKIINRYRDINSKQSSKHARSREIALSKIQLPKKIESKKEILFYFKPKIRSGEEVLRVTDLTKSFNNQVLFTNINFLVKRQDKIGIVGDNGIGKTTLFNILRKKIQPDSGRIEYGAKVHYAFFDQESNDLKEYSDFNLIDVIRESNIDMSDGEIRDFLATFLFTEEDVFKKVGDLSGGEKVRIKLAQIMLTNANFLIMDEPTNHIDMETKEILENVLLNYQGTLLFISHDRYFLDKIADHIYEFTPNGINEYLGNYTNYLKKKESNSNSYETPTLLTKTQRQKNNKKSREFRQNKTRLQKEIKQIEQNLEENEEVLAYLEKEMSSPDFYKKNSNTGEIINQYNQIKKDNIFLTEQWENLSLEFEEIEKSS